MEKRGQFTFYRSYFEAVVVLPEEVQKNILFAIIRYGLDGVEPQGLEDVEKAIFILAKPTLDSGRKMAAGGKKGYLTRRSQKALPNEKEKEKEKEMEKENKKENEIETETEDECPQDSGFDSFWETYPVKIDKTRCRKIYGQLIGEEAAILGGLQDWLGSKQWQLEGGRYIPRPAKFLQERHYLQRPPQAVPYGASGELGQAELEAIERAVGGYYDV